MFVLAKEQLQRGEPGTTLCTVLAEAAEVAFVPRSDGNSGRHFPRPRRPT